MMRVSRRGPTCFAATAALATGCWLVGGAAPAGAAEHPHSGTLFVSARGAHGHGEMGCGNAQYRTISAAVAAAPAGGRVMVCHGTYHEDVLVQKPLELVGLGATIDATGLENAIQVVSSDVTVRGFALLHANGEGLLVGVDTPSDAGLLPPESPILEHVRVEGVRAEWDDQGFNGTENSNCKYPGDCGGGIHFNGVEWSSVSESVASHNADGILLTDDYAPTAHNDIDGNEVSDNHTECGIVLPGHNGNAVSFTVGPDGTFTVTGRNPDMGGIYDNTIRDNVVLRNGTARAPAEFGGVGGSGSGIGIFGSFPGTGAYDNVIEGNYLQGNGLAGFTIHAHHPGGEDVNGNRVVGNTFGTNNVMGDPFDGTVTNLEATTAIAVYAVPSVSMTIADNVIRDNHIGIWLTNTVHAEGLGSNTFENVPVHVVVRPVD